MNRPTLNGQERHIRIETIIDRVEPLCVLGVADGMKIADVVFDHREVKMDALFCCLVGQHIDGHNFAREAALAGATAFICEHSVTEEVFGAVQLVVAPGTARIAMARAACAFYGDPSASMKTIGVTGTNGKTTTTYLLRSILERNGLRTGVLGTLDGARTTPESPHLQRALARQRDAGCKAMAIEVSSHALVQNRVAGMRFDVALFTNLTHDHLDFHGTMESYFQAKLKLFTPEYASVGVVNADDAYGRRILDYNKIPVESYSLDDAKDLKIGVSSSEFRYAGRLVRLGLGGRFNVANALGAAKAAATLGISDDVIAEGLSAAPPVAGRFEAIEAGGVVVLVDYAHTPNGLEEVLHAARSALEGNGLNVHSSADPTKHGRLLVVFGAGGDRDRGKRPAMGAIASQFADGIVLTSDNPRGEDPDVIIGEIRAGVDPAARIVVEPDRRRAIALALSQARPGDVVVVAGKGHETTQQFADRTIRFDDREVVREEFARLGLNVGENARPRP
ncbi:MAG TPA: UDP-N-acetylmuramoyl-L-alanyl-D-glutamate--2,6-diaminopimelate ligase [Acidimicrobiales bacterium]|nr:UDP-N-acetylmuramoyl-L-alanyl-D-glutamate--2,6-diaminopimelate ligase [Acidimicrobiales bacterium]